MKSIKNVFDQTVSYESLYKAYCNAKTNKRYKPMVLEFSANLEDNLYTLHAELVAGTYQPGAFREFHVPRPKKRLIMVQPFRDRVVQWAIYQTLQPLFVNGYITHSFACIEGRGTHKAVSQLHRWLHPLSDGERGYYLKLDISKFYYRINQDILMGILRRRISDAAMLALLEKFVYSNGTAFGLPPGLEPAEVTKEERILDTGIPVGSLLSTMFANLYLNELDQHCKRRLSIRHYIRYMDDVVILSDSKPQLHEWKAEINTFLQEQLRLDLNKKTCIRPVTQGVEFCGYKLWPTHIKLRKSTALKMKHNLKRVMDEYAQGKMPMEKAQAIVNAYLGILKHCNSYALKKAIFGEYTETVQEPGWFYLRRDK